MLPLTWCLLPMLQVFAEVGGQELWNNCVCDFELAD